MPLNRPPTNPMVLVIEDEALVRTVLDKALLRHGFAVRLAASGEEAVALYQQHHENIALVLLDVQMPGMDGPETLAALKKIKPEFRCCFMSGDTTKYPTEELLRMGACHVIPKPFTSLSQLTRMLLDLIRLG